MVESVQTLREWFNKELNRVVYIVVMGCKSPGMLRAEYAVADQILRWSMV